LVTSFIVLPPEVAARTYHAHLPNTTAAPAPFEKRLRDERAKCGGYTPARLARFGPLR
jgi:hypothetical protein